MKGVDDLKKRIISILFGLIPFIQFFLGGWIFFGVSLILMIMSYFIIRKNSSLNFVVYALVLIASQTAVFMNGVSNIPLFVYMAIASALFLVAASDEKVIDNLRKELNQAGVKTKEGVFELCFFGMGEINDLESLSGLKTTVVFIGDGRAAFTVPMPKSTISRTIMLDDIIDYGVFRLAKKQSPIYYTKISEMFLPAKRLRTLHKPEVETYGLYIDTADERLSFYEEPKVLQKLETAIKRLKEKK